MEIERWYREHGAALLLFGTTLTGDRTRAQDALHQVFLRLIERRGLQPVSDIRTYLFTALRNTLLNDSRYRARDVPLAPNDAEPWFAPSGDYVQELGLRQALARLPDEQREVAVLHIWGGLTFAQAAQVLAVNANTAAARYRYALAKLREILSTERSAHARPGE